MNLALSYKKASLVKLSGSKYTIIISYLIKKDKRNKMADETIMKYHENRRKLLTQTNYT